MNKYVSGAISVEIELSPNKNKFFFPDVELLRNKRIKHIEFVSIAKTPSGNTVNTLLLRKTFITLVEQNTQAELIQNLHVQALNYANNKLFIDKLVDFSKSYITVQGASSVDLTNKSLLFVVWFDEPDVWGVIPKQENRVEISSFEIKLTGARTYFSENRDLRDKRFQNLLLEFPDYTPTGSAVINYDIGSANNKFITLRRKNKEFFVNVPLVLFYQRISDFKLRLQNIQFDFETSYIDTLTTTADDLKTVFFNAIIDDNNKSLKSC